MNGGTPVQDANSKLTTSVYLANRNLVEATVNAMGYRTVYVHDSQSRLVSTRDANGGFVTNVFDSAGYLAAVLNQLGERARQYGYDLAGRVVTFSDAAGRLRTHTFDAAGQNTATQFPDGKIVTNQFDRIGQRTTMIDWGGTSTYTFNGRGNPSGQTDAAGFVQPYSYDGSGNRRSLELVGTGKFTFTFDTLNRLASAQKPGNLLYTMQYDADSRKTTMLLGQGSRRQYQYDAKSQLTTQIELNVSNTPIVTLTDSYDPVGNRMTRSVNGTVASWTYDDLYRLTGQMKPGQVATYTLDGVGNLKTMWEGGNFPKTFTVDAADRLVTMVEGTDLTTYTWTGYGALASEVTGNQTTGYSYNGQDQLIGITYPDGKLGTYTFGGDRLRRSAQEPTAAGPTTMVWNGTDYVLLQGPVSNALVLTLRSRVIHAGGLDFLLDNSGHLLFEISEGAVLSDAFAFTPYGSPVLSSPIQHTPFGYGARAGYYTDSPLFFYVRRRSEHPNVGRWLQADPIWPRQRAYKYVGASPIRILDYHGLYEAGPDLGGDWPSGYWSPIEHYAYGNYCGKCNYKHGPDRPAPRDCIDSYCQTHDDCLEAAALTDPGYYFHSSGMKCNCALYAGALICIYGGGCLRSSNGNWLRYEQCMRAARDIEAAFFLMCGASTGNTIIGGIVDAGTCIVQDVGTIVDEIRCAMPTPQMWQQYLSQ